jgi:hypothetical protein
LETRQFGYRAAAIAAAAVAAHAPVAAPSGEGAADPAFFLAPRACRSAPEAR